MFILAEADWGAVFDSPFVVPVCGGIVVIVVVLSSVWRSLEKTRIEARLKEQMIASGFSADEIERVIRATKGGDEDDDAEGKEAESQGAA